MTRPSPAMPGPDDTTQIVLDNGLTVLVRENHAAPVTVIDGYLPAGSIHDPAEKAGVASFVAAMLTRGSDNYDFETFNETVEGVGANLSAAASEHRTSFGATSLSEDFPTMLRTLADILRRPTFPPEHVQRVRSQHLVQIQEQEQDTQDVAGMRFFETLYRQHPYGRPPIGYAQTVSTIERDDLVAYHAQHYTPQGAVIVVVGDVQTRAAIDQIAAAFGDWQGPLPNHSVPAIPALHDIQANTYPLPGKVQADLFVGAPAVRRRHPDYMAVRVANTVLGRFGMMGRLGANVREEQGLAYYVYSAQETGPHAGAWYAAAGVNPGAVEQALESVRHEFARLRDEPVPEDELADSQAFLTGSLPLQLETNEGVAAALLNIAWYDLGLDYLVRYNDLIRGITVDDVQRVAQQYLRPDAYVQIVAGPPQA